MRQKIEAKRHKRECAVPNTRHLICALRMPRNDLRASLHPNPTIFRRWNNPPDLSFPADWH